MLIPLVLCREFWGALGRLSAPSQSAASMVPGPPPHGMEGSTIFRGHASWQSFLVNLGDYLSAHFFGPMLLPDRDMYGEYCCPKKPMKFLTDGPSFPPTVTVRARR